MDNVLIQYKGGGYDGCFWEWNYACIIDGKFYDINSTGRNGCETRERLDDFIANAHIGPYSSDYYGYAIPDGLGEFATECNSAHVQGVAIFLYDNFGIEITAKCNQCGREFPAYDREELLLSEYKSMGGIVVAPTDFTCYECYCTPSDVEVEEASIDLTNDLRDDLLRKFPELYDIDPDFNLYKALMNALMKKSDGYWEKEDGEYVYFYGGVDELIKHLTENMSEFRALFGESYKPPLDAILREAGFQQLPGFEGV